MKIWLNSPCNEVKNGLGIQWTTFDYPYVYFKSLFFVCRLNDSKKSVVRFLPRDDMLSAAYAVVVCLSGCLCVCLSVCYTPVLYQNG